MTQVNFEKSYDDFYDEDIREAREVCKPKEQEPYYFDKGNGIIGLSIPDSFNTCAATAGYF